MPPGEIFCSVVMAVPATVISVESVLKSILNGRLMAGIA